MVSLNWKSLVLLLTKCPERPFPLRCEVDEGVQSVLLSPTLVLILPLSIVLQNWTKQLCPSLLLEAVLTQSSFLFFISRPRQSSSPPPPPHIVYLVSRSSLPQADHGQDIPLSFSFIPCRWYLSSSVLQMLGVTRNWQLKPARCKKGFFFTPT